MEIKTSELKRVTLIQISGRVDSTNANELGEALNAVIDSGRTQIVLDLSEVDYMNSAGLRELVRIYEQVSRTGGMVHIANPSPQIQKLLELVGLDSVFQIHFDQLWSMARLTHHGLPVRRHQVCVFA